MSFLEKLTLTIVFIHREALTHLVFVPSAVSTIAFCIICKVFKNQEFDLIQGNSYVIHIWFVSLLIHSNFSSKLMTTWLGLFKSYFWSTIKTSKISKKLFESPFWIHIHLLELYQTRAFKQLESEKVKELHFWWRIWWYNRNSKILN